jgi:hypothetical protein
MQWMLDLRTYGMKKIFCSTADDHIDWQGDGTVREDPIHHGGFSRHGLVVEANRILQEKLFFAQEDEISPIPGEKLRDDPVNKQPG